MEKIKVGMIGCGGHSGANICPALSPAGLELIAVCDKVWATAEARAKQYNIKKFYTDYREMCDSEEIDAVLVVIGPEAHYELAIPLVQRGYHVWIEKPCSATAAQAEEMVQAAEEAGRMIQVGFNYRYTVGIQKAMSLIQNGQFARPGMIEVHWWLGDYDIMLLLHHYMVHAVDLVRYVAGTEITMTDAEHCQRDERHYYIATFRDSDGDLIIMDFASGMPFGGHWSRVDWHSADGILSVDDFTRVTHFRRYRDKPATFYDGDHIWRTESMFTKNPFVKAWGYVDELILFREAVQGLRKPEVTIQEAAWGMHLCEKLVSMAKN